MCEGFGTKYESNPIFPMMFVSIAYGAISGFHATQSPLMARCIKDARHGRPVFYGAMVTEGIVALIWAAATAFFKDNGIANAHGAPFSGAAVATAVSENWLGIFGSILALLGIVAATITSGDTALRSARLIVADAIHAEQKSISKRLMISIPLFVATFCVLLYSLADKNGFNVVWRYFAWCNQTLSVFTLWTITVYFCLKGKNYFLTLIPALWMTAVCTSYVFVAPECLDLMPESDIFGPIVGAVAASIGCVFFFV